MRWTVYAGGIGLLALASCASPVAAPASQTAKSPASAVVLTERTVPAGGVEYVVRTVEGETMAIVQARTPGLHPGASVTVLRGERTTLAAR